MSRVLQMFVALTIIAQGAQVAHFALVEHTVCSEHGELVHRVSAADVERNDHHHDFALAGDIRPSFVSVTAQASGYDHDDHCLTRSHGRYSVVPVRIDRVVTSECIGPAAAYDTHTVFVAIRVLDVAPKSSPPFA